MNIVNSFDTILPRFFPSFKKLYWKLSYKFINHKNYFLNQSENIKSR